MGVLLKRIFWGLPFLVLALMMVLTFFQYPCSDDFAGHYLAKIMGYGEATRYYLWHENGRFSSVPLFIFFTQFRFILDHYYTGLIFFLLASYLALFFFLRYTVRMFYETGGRAIYYHRLTAFSMLVLLVCMPEPASFFSWLATDTTYLISFLCLLLYLVKLHQVFSAPSVGNKVIHLAVLFFLIPVLGGANEVSLFFSFFLFMFVFGYRFFLLKQRTRELYIILLMHVLTILLVLWMPGNGRRSGGYTQKQFFIYSAAGSLYQLFQLFFYIFSSPVFWLAAAMTLYSSRYLKEAVKERIRNKRTPLWAELLVLFSAVFLFCFIIRQVAGIVVPLRARNIMVCIMVPALLLIAVVNSHRLPSIPPLAIQRKGLLFLGGIFVLAFNPFMYGLMQSLIDAPVHDEVMSGRIALIKQARAAGAQKVVFRPYGEAFTDLMKQKYGAKTADFLNVEFPAPPKMLYFQDDAASASLGAFYTEYYGIDTVMINNEARIRYRLTDSYRKAKDDKIDMDY